MKMVKHKLFFVWNYDNEEKWINQMAAEGWQLTDVSLFKQLELYSADVRHLLK